MTRQRTTAAKASRDQHMYIGVVVNANQAKPDNDANVMPPPAGARAAWRWRSAPAPTCGSCRIFRSTATCDPIPSDCS